MKQAFDVIFEHFIVIFNGLYIFNKLFVCFLLNKRCRVVWGEEVVHY